MTPRPSDVRNLMMHYRRLTGLFGLLLLLLSVTLHARAIYFDTPVVSSGYDFGHDRPMNVGDTFRTDQLPLWASTVLHGALPDTKVTITLYYMHPTDGKSPLYEEEVYVTGTQPVVLRISTEKAEAFPVTDYFVEFKIPDAPPTSTRFRLTQGGSAPVDRKKPRGYPSQKEDEATLQKFLERYPSLRSLSASLDLYREDSPDGQLSLILPTAWKRYAVTAPMRMHYRGKEGSLTLTALCIDPANRKKFTPEQILKIHSALLIGRAKLIYPPKILNVSPKEAYLRFAIRQKGEEAQFQRYLVLHYKNGTLTTLSVEVPAASAKVGEFLSSLATASLWVSPQLCHEKGSGKTKWASKPRNCRKPSFARDRQLLDRMIGNNPLFGQRLRSFPVKRFEDLRTGVSLILPSGWKKSLYPDADTIVSMKGRVGKYEYDLELRYIDDSETFKKLDSPNALITLYADMIIKTMREEFGKQGIDTAVSSPTKIVQTSAGAAAYTYLRVSKDGQKRRLVMMDTYDGKRLYLLLISSDDPDPTLANLLLSFGLYSLWTPEGCVSGADRGL